MYKLRVMRRVRLRGELAPLHYCLDLSGHDLIECGVVVLAAMQLGMLLFVTRWEG